MNYILQERYAMFERVMKQAVMNRVLYALIPMIVLSVYLFGLRVLAVIVIANIFAALLEYLFIRTKKNGKITMAAFVTGTLVAMTLPPTIPLWMSAVAAAVAISFGKMMFGGFGTNPFNPAIVGRTFVYVAFPQQMTVEWIRPFMYSDFPGGFVRWSVTEGMRTGATVLGDFKIIKALPETFNALDSFLGFIPGSIGETSSLLILLAALYLIFTKTAKWQPMVSTVLSLLVFGFIFNPSQNPLYFLISGGALFGTVFMTTDPVSQPKGKQAIWIYGIMIGFLTVFIRRYSLFAEGFMFALLLTNSFMPMIEYFLDKRGKKKGVKA